MTGFGQYGSLPLPLRLKVNFKGRNPQLFVRLPLDSHRMVGTDLLLLFFPCLPGVLALDAGTQLTAYLKQILGQMIQI